MKTIRAYCCCLSLIALSACSTVVSGTTQSITVDTPYAHGASCTLTDSKNAQWSIYKTPNSVEVNKGDGPMKIWCRKQGHRDGHLLVEEKLAPVTFGNVLIGGIVGVAVDAASGAAQEYPSNVIVWLEPENFSSTESEALWLEQKEKFSNAYYAETDNGSSNNLSSPIKIPKKQSRERSRMIWHAQRTELLNE